MNSILCKQTRQQGHSRPTLVCVLVFIVLCLSAYRALCQNNYRCKVYNSTDGLPGSMVRRPYQDSRDFLWLATNCGLSMFDGRTFKNYSAKDGLLGSWVVDMTEDNEGNMWVATSEGLFKMFGNKFTKVGDSLPSPSKIAAYGNKIWIATGKGLYIQEKGIVRADTIVSKYLSKKTCTFLKLNNGQFLVMTDQGAGIVKDNTIKILWRMPNPEYVISSTQDGKGRIWFSTLFSNIYIFNDSLYQPRITISDMDTPPRVIKDHSGEITVVGDNSLYFIRNDTIYNSASIGLFDSANMMYKALQDREGNYWIGSTFGLMQYQTFNIKTIQLKDAATGKVYHFANDTNTYISCYNKVYKVRNGVLSEYIHLEKTDYRNVNLHGIGHTLNNIDALEKTDDGSFLIGLVSGEILKYKNGKTTHLVDQNNFLVAHSTIKQQSEIWFFEKKTYRFKDDKIDSSYPAPPARITSSILNEADDEILIGTFKGLYRFKHGIFTVLKIPLNDSMPWINSLKLERDGTLWAGTSGYGLLKLKLTNQSIKLLHIYNAMTEFESDFIDKIAIDNDGTVWATSNAGLYKIKTAGNTEEITHIGTEEGLSNSNYLVSLGVTNNGEVYITGPKGIDFFHKDAVFFPTTPQKTHITSILANNVACTWNKADTGLSFFGIPKSHQFRYNENSISFKFTGINYSKPAKIKYQYYLDNFSTDKLITTSDNITFFNLPPGKYVFKVRSTVFASFTNEEYTSFSFEIATPFWATLWFRLLVVVLLVSILALLLRWRIKSIDKARMLELAVQKELGESRLQAFQARMNPHFIFNSLNSIQSFVLNNDKIYALNYLSKFSKLLRKTLDNSLRTKISLEQEVDMLTSYIQMEELRFDHGFNFEIVLNENIAPANLFIPGMIIQPFVENAIIHGLMHKKEKGLLQVHFSLSGQQLICTVEDNGIGRAKSAEINAKKSTNHQSQGTAIAINRLRLLSDVKKGIINDVTFVDLYDDGHEAGLKVIIKLPLL